MKYKVEKTRRKTSAVKKHSRKNAIICDRIQRNIEKDILMYHKQKSQYLFLFRHNRIAFNYWVILTCKMLLGKIEDAMESLEKSAIVP